MFAQCPVINFALIKPCDSTNGEGRNEFIVFTTTATATAGDYTFFYGSNAVPSGNPSNKLLGSKASDKTSTGSITANVSCTLHFVTAAATSIPSGSVVIFIPANFDANYDFSSLCLTGNLYIVYIDASASEWNILGSMSNGPAAPRYLQITNGNNSCESNVRMYENNWPNGAKKGNYVSWDIENIPSYGNNNCILTTPVKLLSFSVIPSGKNANIVWQTTSEINAKSFEIERSSNGTNFFSIASIEAAGNRADTKKYSTVDNNIPLGASYYRLKMIDKDGTFSYSYIVRIMNAKGGFVFANVYPIPVTNQLNISWHSPRAGKTSATVYDYAGRAIFTNEITAVTGNNFYQLSAASLPKGQYMLKLEKDGETITTHFSK